MQLGMIGLGRMGANLVRRLMRDGHECVVYDVNADAVKSLAAEGATGATTLQEFVDELTQPRAAWIMVPAAVVDATLGDIVPLLDTGDILIDGGNSYYLDDLRRADGPEDEGHPLRRRRDERRRVRPRARLLPDDRRRARHPVAPRPDLRHDRAGSRLRAARTPGLTGAPEPRPRTGYLHCGPNGAGHFVKMVHNGIEYGLMAAYAEGLNVLAHADAGKQHQEVDAETTPLRNPELLPVRPRHRGGQRGVAARQRRRVVAARPHRARAERVADSSTTSRAACRTRARAAGPSTRRSTWASPHRSSAPRCSAGSQSRGEADFANRLLSAMRKEFGGHDGEASRRGVLR